MADYNEVIKNLQTIQGMPLTIRLAIEAIEKQVPKKPKNHSGHYTDNLCPLCGKRIKSGQGSSSRERTNWCNHCGQSIDWE
ncbi:MAG: hypothetical protein KBS43_04625 [Oscillospiraceae bacterium]|nr:hypothetical protein [Candidatus Limimonas coprohippi]